MNQSKSLWKEYKRFVSKCKNKNNRKEWEKQWRLHSLQEI